MWKKICPHEQPCEICHPAPHPDSGLEKLLLKNGELYNDINYAGVNRRIRAADANGYERRKGEEGNGKI